MSTLGDFQRYFGHMLWASCPRCGRYVTLDINALAQRFRPSMSIDRVKPLLRCMKCSERGKLSLGYSTGPTPIANRPSRGQGVILHVQPRAHFIQPRSWNLILS